MFVCGISSEGNGPLNDTNSVLSLVIQ